MVGPLIPRFLIGIGAKQSMRSSLGPPPLVGLYRAIAAEVGAGSLPAAAGNMVV